MPFLSTFHPPKSEYKSKFIWQYVMQADSSSFFKTYLKEHNITSLVFCKKKKMSMLNLIMRKYQTNPK
jgi:hypothetical protein